MPKKISEIDLKQLSKDIKTQVQFSNGLNKKHAEKSRLVKEFTASGGKGNAAPTPKSKI